MSLLDHYITVPINLLGGYQESRLSGIGQPGTMSDGSYNYIQAPYGLVTRKSLNKITLGRMDNIEARINIYLKNRTDPAKLVGDMVKVVGVYTHTMGSNLTTRYYIFALLWEAEGLKIKVREATVSFLRYEVANSVKTACPIVLGVRVIGSDILTFTNSPGFPIVTMLFLENSNKGLYIVSFPCLLGSWPFYLWPNSEMADGWAAFNFKGKEEGSEKIASSMVPTCFTTYTVKDTSGPIIIWGLSPDGSIRATPVLTTELLDKKSSVERLLVKEDKENFVVPLRHPSGEILNRGMVEYNGVLFFFSANYCTILTQLLVFNNKKLELAPFFVAAPFRCGVMSQGALQVVWNELYAAQTNGDILQVQRVLQGGAIGSPGFSQASLLKNTGILTSPAGAEFAAQSDHLPIGTTVADKTVQLAYNNFDNTLVAVYYNTSEKENYFQYRTLAISDGSSLPPDGGGISRVSRLSDVEANIFDSGGYYFSSGEAPWNKGLERSEVLTTVPLGAMGAEGDYFELGWPYFYHWKYCLTSPFFTIRDQTTTMLVKYVKIEIERLGVLSLEMNATFGTELDGNKQINNYVFASPFALNEGRFGADRFSFDSSACTVLVGLKGVFFYYKISFAPDPLNPDARVEQHYIPMVTLWVKPIGGLVYGASAGH